MATHQARNRNLFPHGKERRAISNQSQIGIVLAAGAKPQNTLLMARNKHAEIAAHSAKVPDAESSIVSDAELVFHSATGWLRHSRFSIRPVQRDASSAQVVSHRNCLARSK